MTLAICLGLPGRPCTNLVAKGRCPSCRPAWEARRPSAIERYGPGYQRRHREAIADEPWCHWPGGCDRPITPDNPLTAEHVIPVSEGGRDGPLTVLCAFHNHLRRNRPA
jgi:hypothetical protein